VGAARRREDSLQEPKSPRVPGRLYRLAWSFYLVLAIAAVVWIGLREGTIPLALFLRLDGWWFDLGLGVASGLLLLGLWHLGLRFLPLAGALEGHLTEVLGPLPRDEALALALLSGFAEELFFRGAMQGSLGFLAASVLFALLHTGPGPAFRLWTLFAAVAGLAFGALMLWRGNLLAPVVAHALVNGVNLVRLTGVADHSGRLARGHDSAQNKES